MMSAGTSDIDCTFRTREGLCFIDREVEVRQLLELLSRRSYTPIAVYGPEGCGKTTLLQYFTHKLREIEDVVTIYVNALEHTELKDAIKLIPDMNTYELLREVLSEVPRAESIGRVLALSIKVIVEHILRKLRLRGRTLVVILDDVYKAIGLENVDKFTKLLYEWQGWSLAREYNLRNVVILLSTSEGTSKRELLRHTYVEVKLLWNLPKRALYALADQVKCPLSIDELWCLTGGNPRAILDLWYMNWDVKMWLEKLKVKIRAVLADLDKHRIRNLLEDPDADPRTAQILEDRGLMIYLLDEPLVLGEKPRPDPELGIGREWAWQIPAYRKVLLELLS